MEPINAILLVILLLCCSAIVWVVKEVIREKIAPRGHLNDRDMSNQIEKIRAEIDRRLTENCVLAEKTESFVQRLVEDNEILAFIDRLTAEKPAQGWSNWDEAMRNRAMYYIQYFQTHVADTKAAQECMTWIKQLLGQARPVPAEESPKADLEAEIERYESVNYGFDGSSRADCLNIARHFAEWGAEHLKR